MSNYQTVARSRAAAAIDEGLRAYMNRVYGLMAAAMAITGVVAYVIGTSPTLLAAIYGGPQKYVVMFAPLLVVFAFGAAINRMSQATAQLVFWGFAALMGASMSFIFAVYTGVSIAQTFFVTAIAFGGLSLYGYVTKRDLSGFGTFLVMGVIGLIVASIVNIFLVSSALQFAISVVGVLIFAGLTAYDTQQIKNEYLGMSQMGAEGEAVMGKASIMGALRLYLDFINMFMFLLHFLGNRE
ncbi:Bax inhibitor-1/YccA family protein [Oceanicella actignis]|uniref:Modulator of FtsH protease n=1 Tax=Oceanicella actignis TaxID=1189325 RepID=A0A1M7TX00_9RHOB|nr:Bax inhibitor-1/YccA family protein [Oceanicella actignis]SET79732.1 hypothetical protein SAMN04488119_11010 [Oceanicella actignis]SHN75236.1 hypothetical protein SAMN05216200_11110 [Oceanicella actignis]